MNIAGAAIAELEVLAADRRDPLRDVLDASDCC